MNQINLTNPLEIYKKIKSLQNIQVSFMYLLLHPFWMCYTINEQIVLLLVSSKNSYFTTDLYLLSPI